VEGLYRQLLQRTPSQDEITSWVGQLAVIGRDGVAAGFLRSQEYRERAVRTWYATLLGRTTAPSAAEVTGWARTRLDQRAIQLAFASSLERFGFGHTGLDANQRYVQAIYQHALGRPASEAEAGYWEGVLLTKGSAEVVRGVERSHDSYLHGIRGLYQALLERAPTAAEEAATLQLLDTGTTEEQVFAQLLASQELYNRVAINVPGATPDQAWVTFLITAVLDRPPINQVEVNAWVGALRQMGRPGVALAIVQSAEFRIASIDQDYTDILHRPAGATPAEAVAWLASGQSQEWIMEHIEASFEAFVRA
jgi:hypothetical protein